MGRPPPPFGCTICAARGRSRRTARIMEGEVSAAMANRANSPKLFGIVTVHRGFAFLVAACCYVLGLRFGGDLTGWIVVVVASVLLHDLGQLAALRMLGVPASLELGLSHVARPGTLN